MSTLIGVDIGGTFTDVVVVDRGRVTTAKVSSTPDDPVARDDPGDRRGAGRRGHRAGVGRLASRTARRSPPTRCSSGAAPAPGWSTTRGFADVLELARQARPHLYRPCCDRPRPLPELTAEVDERLSPDGVLRRLDPESVRRGGPPAAARGGGGGGRLPAAQLRRSPPRAARGGRPARRAAGRVRRRLARDRSRVPRVRAGVDRVRGRLPGAARRALPPPAGRGTGRARAARAAADAVERRPLLAGRGRRAPGPAAACPAPRAAWRR